MSQVTNQLPYTEIKPLPFKQEVCPILRKLIQRVALFVAITGFSTGFGIALGLSNFSISILTGALLGGVIGGVISLSLAFFMHFPSKEVEYYLGTLKQIKETTGNPRALVAIQALEGFFQYPFTRLRHCYDQHTLHKYLQVVTRHLDPERVDAKQAWLIFLQQLDEKALHNADGEIILFSTKGEISSLSAHFPTFGRSWLSTWSRRYEKDLEEIEVIRLLSLGKEEGFSQEKMTKTLYENRPSGCVVAHDTESGNLVGYCWYYTENGITRIAEFARRPEIAGVGLGLELVYEAVRANHGKKLQLTIRENHPFISRLQRLGFQAKEKFTNYFQASPKENGVLLEMDWDKHNKRVNEQ